MCKQRRDRNGNIRPAPSRLNLAPPRRPSPGCVISLLPFGVGVAYKVTDQYGGAELRSGVARDHLSAIEAGKGAIESAYGEGEPAMVVAPAEVFS